MELVPRHIRLIKRARWLIKLRWIAIAGVVMATLLAVYALELKVEALYMYIIAVSLAVANGLYIFLIKKTEECKPEKTIRNIIRIINIQIAVDLVALTVLLHFSGGIENPFIIAYIFHMTIAGIVLTRRNSFIQTSFALVLFTGLTILEYAGIINHYTLNENISELLLTDPGYLFSALAVFIIASYLVVYMTTNIAQAQKRAEQAYREANEELEEKDKIKNEYVQRVTHDIKGHLAVINSSLSIVSKGMVGEVDPQNKEFVDRAYRRSEQLTSFVKELLHLTNMRLNNVFEPEPFSLRETAENALQSVSPNAESKNIELKHIIASEVETIEGVRFSVEEVIMNLLLNAIKYTPEGGKVGLKIRPDGEYVCIAVSDTGVGIPEEEIPKVFEEFFRASNVKKTVSDGTGLGLSLVKQIIDRHNGEISVESKLDEGSTFRVKLPLKQNNNLVFTTAEGSFSP